MKSIDLVQYRVHIECNFATEHSTFPVLAAHDIMATKWTGKFYVCVEESTVECMNRMIVNNFDVAQILPKS